MTDQLYYDSIDLLRDLIASPRHSRHETEAADLLEQYMCRTGLTPMRLHNNIIAHIGEYVPDRPTLLLNSHIDTVPAASGWTRDPYSPDIIDGRLYGLGSNDAGASLVSLLAVAIYMHHHPELHERYNIIFVASAQEEVSGSEGIQAVIPTLPHIDTAIVGEPTNLNPAIAEKGLLVIDAVITGEAAHAATGLGVNAIYRASGFINQLRNTDFSPISPSLGDVHLTVAQIHAGTKHNIVPDRCEMVIDVRTTDTCPNSRVLDILSANLPQYITLAPRSTHLNASSIPEAHPLIQRLVTLGHTPYGSPTLSDQALMPWPSFKLGPGLSSRSHTPDEFILLDDIRHAQALYLTILSHLNL